MYLIDALRVTGTATRQYPTAAQCCSIYQRLNVAYILGFNLG